MSAAPATHDPRIDDHIARAAPFAQPILARIRADMHAALPAVVETIKWGHPFFLDDGRILGNMAAFKAHCSLGFWKTGRPLAEAVAAASDSPLERAMGQFGRIASVDDLPKATALRQLIREVAAVTAEAAAAPPAPRKPPRVAPPDPQDLLAALDAAPGTRATWDAFSPSHRREYVEWITEAKRDETRARRVAESVALIGEGKTRMWKYRR